MPLSVGDTRRSRFQHASPLHSVVPVTPERGDLRKTRQRCTSSCICIEDKSQDQQHQGSALSLVLISITARCRHMAIPGPSARPGLPSLHTVPSPEPPTVNTQPTNCGVEEPTDPLHTNLPSFLDESRMPVVSASTGEEWTESAVRKMFFI